MTKEDCFELGVISKTFSFRGEVILYIDSDQPEHYYNMDMILLEINKKLVPFFIEESKVHKVNQLRVKFDNVADETDAKRLTKKKVFLPLAALPELEDDQFYYHEIIGFTLVDQDDNKVGEILEYIDNAVNPMLEVSYNGKEALIPYNDNSHIAINKKDRELKVEIPEGLLAIYE
ncbi:ribosome maturation factor RimM [Parvicella tangerina]|uniref:Ribosome maturation factor RimM n=1 Tax=Parvicella tangerina TaxID=2829795 RepID=A0A916JP50_9FLAO|nr:ribosome maturation factor RimM [Parvicella tangerina]CAG5084986.1 Ribosome maturation factor RimM [Parvicella tangerina]